MEAEETEVDMVKTNPDRMAPTPKVDMVQHMVNKLELYKVEPKESNKECMDNTGQHHAPTRDTPIGCIVILAGMT